jgi:hypothetical protein
VTAHVRKSPRCTLIGLPRPIQPPGMSDTELEEYIANLLQSRSRAKRVVPPLTWKAQLLTATVVMWLTLLIVYGTF